MASPVFHIFFQNYSETGTIGAAFCSKQDAVFDIYLAGGFTHAD
jgi:hypothetical protein